MTTMKTFAAALMASTLLAAPALAQSNPPPAAKPATPSTTMQATGCGSGSAGSHRAVGRPVAGREVDRRQCLQQQQREGRRHQGGVTGKDGQVDLIVIGVGGFLGMGEHNVAFKWNQVKFVDQPVQSSTTTTTPRPNTTGTGATTTTTTRTTVRDYPDHAVVNMTKDQLKALPPFKYASDSSRSDTRTDTTKK